MPVLVIGDTEIHARAVPRGEHGFISAVTIQYGSGGKGSGMASHHEWDEPLFETESEALQFAWRRATLLARSLIEKTA